MKIIVSHASVIRVMIKVITNAKTLPSFYSEHGKPIILTYEKIKKAKKQKQ